MFVGHGGMSSPAVSLWNSYDNTQETGLVKVWRKDNFEQTHEQVEVSFSLANPCCLFWKLTALFGMSARTDTL